MKGKAKRFILLALSVFLMVTVIATPIPTSSSEKQYPTVFVHGLLGWGYNDEINNIMPYWGMTAGNILDYLGTKGYEIIDASVGPVSSAWDRACELYAQLSGSKTDYGQAHCDRANAEFLAIANARGDTSASITHQRFGRDYTDKALYSDWSAENKLNLVGHSFGGPTCRMLISLLSEGDAEEIAYAKANYGANWENEINPLFLGGKVDWVNSVTALASVLNGTTYIDACACETDVIMGLALGLANAIGISPLNNIYDFQLEQFGITNIPGESGNAYLNRVMQSDFLEGSDQAIYDLSVPGCSKLNKRLKDYENIYYFSYAGNKTYKNLLTGNYLPKASMWPPFLIFSTKMGRYSNKLEYVLDSNGSIELEGYKYSYINNDWKPNDGMVNTISARYPLTSEHKNFDAANIEAGIWQVMPDQDMDHLEFCGGILNSKPVTIRAFYLKLMQNIDATME